MSREEQRLLDNLRDAQVAVASYNRFVRGFFAGFLACVASIIASGIVGQITNGGPLVGALCGVGDVGALICAVGWIIVVTTAHENNGRKHPRNMLRKAQRANRDFLNRLSGPDLTQEWLDGLREDDD